MNEDLAYLNHIAESIALIHDWTQGSKDTFLENVQVRDAVLRRVQTLAESTIRLSDDQKDAYPDIDWRGIAGFRNIVTHNYMGIDLDITWTILQDYLPKLEKIVLAMIEASNDS